MMIRAVVTGSPERARAVAGALRAEGFEIVAEAANSFAEIVTRTPERSVHCYVQLSTASGLGLSLAQDVMARVEAIGVLAPVLGRDAALFMVADDDADPAHDPRVADALRLLTEFLADKGDRPVKVSIWPGPGSPSDIAAAVRAALPNSPRGVPAPFADYGSSLGYADWRNDVLSLTSVGNATYFGWVNRDGSLRVGILRGSVVSPLAMPPGRDVSWGDCGPGAYALARALLAEVLEADAGDLVELFVKEVIDSLPAEGFDLPAAAVERWVQRHRPN
jgi:hypothetical protein